MSVSYMIGQDNNEVMETDYFVEQLRKKWPGVRIGFIEDQEHDHCFNLTHLMISLHTGIFLGRAFGTQQVVYQI